MEERGENNTTMNAWSGYFLLKIVCGVQKGETKENGQSRETTSLPSTATVNYGSI